MKPEQNDKVFSQIWATPALADFASRLQTAVAARRGENQIGFDPLLILMVISVLIQVVRLWLERNKTVDDVATAITQLQTLPARRTILLRRRLGQLWREYCAANQISSAGPNPLLGALFDAAAATSVEAAKSFADVSLTTQVRDGEETSEETGS
jgi:hypothetical protein